MNNRIPLCVLALLLLGSQVLAQQTQRNMVKEQLILDQLKKIAPGAVDRFKSATVAMDEGKYDDAVKLYEAVILKAPDFDPAIRRLGLSLTSQGKYSEGRDMLEYALTKTRSPENLISMAQTLSYPSEGKEGGTAEKRKALALVNEAIAGLKDKGDESYYVLQATLALELDQLETFRSATQHLVVNYPDLMQTHYFNAILAATDSNWFEAENEIRKAESLGLPHEAAEAFLNAGVRSSAQVWRYAYFAVVLVIAWIVGLFTLFLVGKLMSRLTLRSIEAADPNVVTSQSDLTLRKWYRMLISIGGLYYFVSIPIVVFLVLAVAGSLTYGAFMVGRIPIKLLLILDIGAAVTVFKMIRSLFLRLEKEDPGRSLAVTEAPGLWALTRSVAEAVQTRPIDEIRLTPGTELAVYERGSLRERTNNKANRILILGVGTLNGFKQNAFRAVLAHEYGHFSNRDTAGGDVALRVNDHMYKFAHAMYASGQAVWWNVAFQFLRIYDFIFRRLSHGATRLQEVLADRVAAAKYGAESFEEGLRHVIMKSTEFESLAMKEIQESTAARRALQNLYELNYVENADVAEAAENQLNRKTTEDDTHPSPADRFRLTRKVTSRSEPALPGMVWDLFTDREALTNEMTSLVQAEIR